MNKYENVKREIRNSINAEKPSAEKRGQFFFLPQEESVTTQEVPAELTVNVCESMDRAFSVLHSQYMRGRIGPVSIEKLASKAKQELPIAKLWVKTFKQSKVGSFLT